MKSQIGNRKSEIEKGLLSRTEARRRLFRLYAGHRWSSLFCWLRYWHSNVPGIEAHVPTEGTILDLGCGHGVLANYLALRSPRRRVLGFDLSEHRIAIARSVALPNAEFHCQDLFADVRQAHVALSRSKGAEWGGGEEESHAEAAEKAGEREAAEKRPSRVEIANRKSEIGNPLRAIIVADVLHHLRSYDEGDELLARCVERLPDDGLLLVKEIGKRPLWKYLVTRPVDTMFYEGKVYFRSAEQFARLFERLGLDATFVLLHAWRPLCHVMYVCRKQGARRRAPCLFSIP